MIVNNVISDSCKCCCSCSCSCSCSDGNGNVDVDVDVDVIPSLKSDDNTSVNADVKLLAVLNISISSVFICNLTTTHVPNNSNNIIITTTSSILTITSAVSTSSHVRTIET